MKRITDFLLTVTLILAITLVVAVIPTERDVAIYADTLRLHILANSDSGEDQELKLKIRDNLLKKYGEVLKDGDSIESAKATVEALIPEIEADVMIWVRELGYSYTAKATLGVEWYETRKYEDFTLPAGYYSSLRIIIGEGDGQNWWCVMYPPLCMEMATESAPADDGLIDYTDEELLLIKSEGYQVKFKILEELSRAFSKNG